MPHVDKIFPPLTPDVLSRALEDSWQDIRPTPGSAACNLGDELLRRLLQDVASNLQTRQSLDPSEMRRSALGDGNFGLSTLNSTPAALARILNSLDWTEFQAGEQRIRLKLRGPRGLDRGEKRHLRAYSFSFEWEVVGSETTLLLDVRPPVDWCPAYFEARVFQLDAPLDAPVNWIVESTNGMRIERTGRQRESFRVDAPGIVTIRASLGRAKCSERVVALEPGSYSCPGLDASDNVTPHIGDVNTVFVFRAIPSSPGRRPLRYIWYPNGVHLDRTNLDLDVEGPIGADTISMRPGIPGIHQMAYQVSCLENGKLSHDVRTFEFVVTPRLPSRGSDDPA